MQALRGLVRQNFYLLLCEDLPVINPIVDVVQRAARHCFARDESLFPCFTSWELRQECWVSVDDAMWKGLQHWLMQNAHEPREYIRVNTGYTQRLRALVVC